MASHISGASTSQLKEIRQDVAGFWCRIFKTEHKVFKQANNEYTGWMKTDGVSSCVLRRRNGMQTQAHGRKRKRGEPASERRERTYHDIAKFPTDELQAERAMCSHRP